MTLMRPSSVHSLHCLEPRSYWSPRKTFRYCNHYFIQRPVDARTEREVGWGVLSVAKNLPLNLPSLSAHDGWIWVLFFFSLFVCLYVCSFKDQGKVVAHNDNVAGKKKGNPAWEELTYLVRSGNQSEHAIRFLYCAPSRREG